MEPFRLTSGTELPKPLRREVHRHAVAMMGIRDDHHTMLSVVEIEHPTFLSLRGSGATVGEFIAAIAAQRETEGWSIISMDASSATMKRVLDHYRTSERKRT